MCKKILATLGAVAAAGLSIIPAQASLIQVANRAALGTSLTVPWTVFGTVGTAVSVYDQAQVSTETVRINSSSGLLYVTQQGNGFNGDFATNDVLLLQPNPDDGELVGFTPPVSALGFNIDPSNYTGTFTAIIAAYDASDTLLGVTSISGTASGSGAGTAPFLGVTSTGSPISFFNLGLVELGNPSVSQFTLAGQPVLGNIAINEVSIVPVVAPVPEPSSPLMMAMAIGILGLRLRRR